MDADKTVNQKKPSFKDWVEAARLRTLPLALASVLTGSFIAIDSGVYHWSIIILAIVTTLFLQILSNFANDYGDTLKGTDNDERVGPQRTVQSGKISPMQMKNAIILFAVLSFVSGLALIYSAFGNHFVLALLFLLLGLFSIVAAVRYTVGRNAYGYKGLGDLFVFLFFGLTGVAGTWFLNSQQWQWDILLPASAIGLLSAGVLNLNNMRDIDNDLKSGKITLAGKMGFKGARLYHTLLVVVSFGLITWFVLLQYKNIWSLLYILSAPFFLADLIKLFKMGYHSKLDPFLKRLSLSILLLSILLGVGLLL